MLDREREHIDPRLTHDKSAAEVRLVKLVGPRARPARLEAGAATLIPRGWVGGSYFPAARNWTNYGDKSIRGWEVTADDFLTAVGHDDPRWDEPGNRL